jgi:filamentous hemagglutinin
MKNKTSHKMKHYRLSFGRRFTAGFMAAFMLMQICLPTVAYAATLLSNDKITGQLLANSEYQGSASSSYLFEKAAYLNQTAPIQNETIETFFKSIVAAKIALPKPTLVPIAGDITIFVPVYLQGKSVGDAYVQTRFVRTQINDLLGRHLIDVGSDKTEIEQINILYKRAKDFATNNKQYRFGDNLPASQTISADMIWPELRNINGQNVLVPIVYLTVNTITTRGVKGHAIDFNGPVAEFGGITLDKTALNFRRDSYVRVMRALTNNGGVINLGDNSTLNSNTIINNGGSINGAGNLTITANGSLQNLSGTISAKQNLDITAAQFTNKTVVYPYTDKYGTGGYLGPISVISAGTRDANGNVSTAGNLSIKSTKGDINFIGSDATATGTMTLDAKGNINILGVTIESNSNGRDGHWQVATNSIEVFKSHLTAQENLRLIAGGAINIQASDLISTQGGIELLAGMGIYILDEQNQTSVQKVDKIGKKTGTESDFQTLAIRSVLRAGKKILLNTEGGDITLRAAKITSGEGAHVAAKNGKVHLLITKEQDQHTLDTVKKGTWTIKTQHHDYSNETAVTNAIVGGFTVEALEGIEIEYGGKAGATLDQQIQEYRNMPDMRWMADFYDGKKQFRDENGVLVPIDVAVNFKEIDLIYKNIRENKTNLSPAAMAIIAIAVCVAMGPAGAGLIGGGGGAIGATTAAGVVSVSTGGAILQAGLMTLATQAAQSLAAGNNLRETINAMDSDESLKSLAISMATAGAMSALDVSSMKMFEETKGAVTAGSLGNQAYQAVVSSTIKTSISVTINGGNSDEYLSSFKTNLATYAADKLGEKMAKKIGDAYDNGSPAGISNTLRYVAHAGAGCVYGMTSAAASSSTSSEKYSCFSGAGGAVIGELVADQFKDHHEIAAKQKATEEWLTLNGIDATTKYENLTPSQVQMMKETMPANFISAAELRNLQATGVDLAKLSAGLAAFVAKGDVSLASDAGGIAAENNALPLLVYAGMLALSALSAYMAVQEAIELGEILSDDTATEEQKAEAVKKYAKGLGIDIAITAAGGGAVKGAKKLIEILRKEGKVSEEVIKELDRVEDAVDSQKKYEADEKPIERLYWGSWKEYPKVTVDDREYAQIGDRLYTGHAVDRMQPSGLGTPAGADAPGRSISPNLVEDVIKNGTKQTITVKGVQRTIHSSGTVQVVTEQSEKIVITVNPFAGI